MKDSYRIAVNAMVVAASPVGCLVTWEAMTKCRDAPSHCQVLGPSNFCIITMTSHHNTHMPPRYRLQWTNAHGGTAFIVWPPTLFVLSTPMLYYFGFTDEPLQHDNDAI
ncbi:hypothetical protein V8C40DRAFT_245653, partial [Trichoderma camerunense]